MRLHAMVGSVVQCALIRNGSLSMAAAFKTWSPILFADLGDTWAAWWRFEGQHGGPEQQVRLPCYSWPHRMQAA